MVHHLPVKNRRPMISLHVVSGPWTSIVAALDKVPIQYSRMQAIQYSYFYYVRKVAKVLETSQ
jgi:hypothetical protein